MTPSNKARAKTATKSEELLVKKNSQKTGLSKFKA
jgi:hypothetical protein